MQNSMDLFTLGANLFYSNAIAENFHLVQHICEQLGKRDKVVGCWSLPVGHFIRSIVLIRKGLSLQMFTTPFWQMEWMSGRGLTPLWRCSKNSQVNIVHSRYIFFLCSTAHTCDCKIKMILLSDFQTSWLQSVRSMLLVNQ